FYYHRFSPIDGVYYRSSEQNPMKVETSGDKKILTLGTGVFICDFENTLAEYEIHLETAVIRPLERGIFLVDTTRIEPIIFSFNSFLKVGLMGKGETTQTTEFVLFPSLLFRYNPDNTTNLKGADILRISLINSLHYLDLKNQEDLGSLFRWENKEDSYFLVSVTDYIKKRVLSFNKLYTEILSADAEKLTKNILLNPDNILFVNDTKKEIILRNLLQKEILQLLQKDPTKKPDDTALRGILSEMKEKSPRLYEAGMATMKRYYYVTSFSRFAHSDKAFFVTNTDSPYLSKIEGILWKKKFGHNESYRHLSDIFSLYYFSDLSFDNLNTFVNELLANIIDNKILKKDEFLSFTFFVTEYLSGWPFPPSRETLEIASLLSTLTTDYYNTLRDDSKRSVLLSTIFYNYNKIFSRLNRTFTETFFSQTPQGIVLKDEYVSGNTPTFPQDFLDSFKSVTDSIGNDIESKKQKFYTLTQMKQDSNMTDNFTLLSDTLTYTKKLRDIFLDYPEYLKSIKLNDKNKDARGILIVQTQEMSRENLETYLSTFNNISLSSLQIFNNFKKDGFYDVQVGIWGNMFTFKLWSQGHTISDVSYIDTSSKKHVFPNVTITLDQKEEQLKELSVSSSEPELRYRYDFKNFFETTFLMGNTNSSSSSQQSTSTSGDTPSKSMTPEMQIFIQNELVEKDFKNIVAFLPISFNNIYATIQNGNYAIDLSAIKKTFQGKDNAYPVELSGKYVFDRHAFYKLNFQLHEPDWQDGYDLGGTRVEILPPRILLMSLEDTIKDLGRYIDTIKKEYQGQQSIIIDCSRKIVSLDNKEYTPDFSITQ
ncbi:MAG: hypothetical protein ACD_78C00060G0001, partial [uncultured bacterium (gcode 4)]